MALRLQQDDGGGGGGGRAAGGGGGVAEGVAVGVEGGDVAAVGRGGGGGEAAEVVLVCWKQCREKGVEVTVRVRAGRGSNWVLRRTGQKKSTGNIVTA